MQLETFATARLEADRLDPGHLPELRRMHSDPVVMAHLGGVCSVEQTSSYLERNLKHWAQYGFGLWIVRERGGQDAIGRAVLRHLVVEGVDDVEVGYAFYEPYWGRGLATEVTATCLRLARECLGLTTVVAVTSPDNFASQHVLRKNGLEFERHFIHQNGPASLFRVTWPARGYTAVRQEST